eukprot:scaffold40250_cov31-Tisochrysis_lutea.AAC.3
MDGEKPRDGYVGLRRAPQPNETIVLPSRCGSSPLTLAPPCPICRCELFTAQVSQGPLHCAVLCEADHHERGAVFGASEEAQREYRSALTTFASMGF